METPEIERELKRDLLKVLGTAEEDEAVLIEFFGCFSSALGVRNLKRSIRASP